MDQGVTRALKAFYCANVVRRQTKYIDAGRTTSKINILEAMRMLVRSWDTVSANTVKNCYREAGILEETQIASINDEDGLFKLLEENINELYPHGLVDGDLTVDDYVNIYFEVCTNETSAITAREILDSILTNDYAQNKEETDEESNYITPEKPKLSEIAHAIELLECWSLFGNSGGETRQSLSLISKRFDKHDLEIIINARFFKKKLKVLLFYKEKNYAASHSKGLLFLYPSSVKN